MKIVPSMRWALWLGLLFLYLPMAVLVLFSFNDGKVGTYWLGFTTRWYIELFQDQHILDALLVSVKVSAVSSVLSCILGVSVAYIFTRVWQSKVLLSSVLLPMLVPDVVIAMGMVFLWTKILPLGFWALVCAHTIVGSSWVAFIVSGRLKDRYVVLEEAARDLGAKPVRVVRLITIPMVLTAVLAGWVWALVLALEDVVFATFLTGAGGSTLPMLLLSSMRFGANLKINALSTIVIICALIAGLISVRRKRCQ